MCKLKKLYNRKNIIKLKIEKKINFFSRIQSKNIIYILNSMQFFILYKEKQNKNILT